MAFSLSSLFVFLTAGNVLLCATHAVALIVHEHVQLSSALYALPLSSA